MVHLKFFDGFYNDFLHLLYLNSGCMEYIERSCRVCSPLADFFDVGVWGLFVMYLTVWSSTSFCIQKHSCTHTYTNTSPHTPGASFISYITKSFSPVIFYFVCSKALNFYQAFFCWVLIHGLRQDSLPRCQPTFQLCLFCSIRD